MLGELKEGMCETIGCEYRLRLEDEKRDGATMSFSSFTKAAIG